MSITRAALAVSSASAVAAFLSHEASARNAVERFAAAALEALLNAVDANDPATGAHVRRVAVYAHILCDAADVSQDDQRMIERIALFHDIGKIHEALFDIVHDDASLTAADRRAIATHPQRGAVVVAPLGGFYPELPEGILSHHERWDGKGYPRGLKGRRIPFGARVVAIVDTFDAITHHRPYRDGKSGQVALDIILEGRGAQFDPELVDIFAFPPVFAEIERARRTVSRWRTPVRPRRTGRDEENVPEITFRWRPGRGVANRRI